MTAAAALAAPPRTLADLPSPPALPLIGHLHRFKPKTLHLLFERWAAELGPMVLLRLGRERAILCTDSALLQQALRERPHHFRRRRTIESVMREMGANGVFSIEGEAWRPQRQLVTKALAAPHFRAFFAPLQAITERLRARWQRAAAEGRTLDMCIELTRYTVDATTTLAFGEDPNTIDEHRDAIQQHLALVFPMLMKRAVAPFPYWRHLRLPVDRRFDTALAAVHAHVRGLIERARARMHDDPAGQPRNLLEALLAESDRPGSGIDDATVVANVITLLLGGEDTTAHSLAWCMPFLAADPALQDRLSEQARHVFGEARVCPSYDDVRALDDFEAVATEATRLKPVVPFLGLETVADITFGGVAVPARTPVFFMLRPDMVDAEHFGDPNRFDPTRWQREAAREAGCPHAGRAHDTRAYVQFGAGPRVCPGRHLAAVEMRLVLSMLMRNFRLQLACDPGQIREILDFTMHPEAMPVRLALRA